MHNAAALGVDLQSLDGIVISHLHPDHVGGMLSVFRRTFSLSADALEPKGLPGYVPTPMRHERADVALTTGPRVIAPGIAVLPPLPRVLFWGGPVAEQALVVNVRGFGLVLVSGCGHPGIERMLAATEMVLDVPIKAVVGGLHLPVHALGTPLVAQAVFGSPHWPWQPIGERDVAEAIDAIGTHGPQINRAVGSRQHAMDLRGVRAGLRRSIPDAAGRRGAADQLNAPAATSRRSNGTGARIGPGARWDTWPAGRYLCGMTSLALDSAAIATTVERAIAGDEVAFARIVGAYHLDLVRVAFVVCGDEGLAEDAAQSAWWIAWRKLPSLRDPDRLRAWLVAIAANEARKTVEARASATGRGTRGRVRPLPRRRPRGARSTTSTSRTPSRRLKPEDRALVALRYAADLDSSELAPVLGISASGVRTRLSRLLDRLRKELGDD